MGENSGRSEKEQLPSSPKYSLSPDQSRCLSFKSTNHKCFQISSCPVNKPHAVTPGPFYRHRLSKFHVLACLLSRCILPKPGPTAPFSAVVDPAGHYLLASLSPNPSSFHVCLPPFWLITFGQFLTLAIVQRSVSSPAVLLSYTTPRPSFLPTVNMADPMASIFTACQ